VQSCCCPGDSGWLTDRSIHSRVTGSVSHVTLDLPLRCYSSRRESSAGGRMAPAPAAMHPYPLFRAYSTVVREERTHCDNAKPTHALGPQRSSSASTTCVPRNRGIEAPFYTPNDPLWRLGWMDPHTPSPLPSPQSERRSRSRSDKWVAAAAPTWPLPP
jgi:hypothetical protein